MTTIADLLLKARCMGASDVHLAVGRRGMVRCNGELRPLDGFEEVCSEEMLEAFAATLPARIRMELRDTGEADCSLSEDGGARCRVNIYYQHTGLAVSVRLLQSDVPDCEELGLPEAIRMLALLPQGLVLVTGPTGSGKSTTLASLINEINRTRACHIITLEDPVEYLHLPKKAFVSQRQVGRDTRSFASGLRSALREDPDVLLVGELRDGETMATALTAAETGHLVLATLHTGSACGTVDRILDAFPENQALIRSQLASCLQGVVCQQLLPRADGRGRIAAFEIMTATEPMRTLIRDGRTHQLESYVQTGSRHGMIAMSDYMDALKKKSLI